ncbi:MAG: hypothetical protein SFV23_15030 [Planctomycetaceae bacterium]|nr:hypothetical protein [Planctomycetaceae bacterium]
MTPRQPTLTSRRARTFAFFGPFVFVVFSLATFSPTRAAEPLREGFESWEATWQTEVLGNEPSRVHRERTESAGRTGRGELIRVQSEEDEVEVRLHHALPAARVLDELTAAVWIRSEHPGWEISLTIVVPGYTDPKTGQPLRFVLPGEVYREPGKWKTLSCRTTNTAVRQRLALLRARRPEIPEPGLMYVDRITLEARIPRGMTTAHIDDLEFGPIVPADVATSEIVSVETDAPSNVPSVEFRLDRLLVNGRPFFPRVVPYHGEPPELLAELGFNVVWVPDLEDSKLIRRLWERGLWVAATPPRPRDETGAPLQAGTAGLVPFTAAVDPVLFWMLGARVPGERHDDIVEWIEQLEFADRRRARPIAADVAYDERRFSRHIDMLAVSRHPLQGSMSLNDYRLWLQDRRSLARPGTFCWTWLQAEAAPAVAAATASSGVEPVLEPEQLRLQAYAAIAAGCRGLGFWTWSTLAGTTPADEERRLALRRLNLELKFLEPWLATAGSVQQIACSATDPTTPAASRNLPFGRNPANAAERDAQLRTRAADSRQRGRRDQELTAYILRTDLGSLAIPMWLEGSSQFVPAQGAISGVSFVVPGSEQTAAAIELSTTSLRSLKSERIAGGLNVEMPALDEVGFVWLTSDLSTVDRARERISAVETASAQLQVKLATLKLDRVGLVDQELQTLGPPQPDAPQKLGRAKLRLERASATLAAGHTHEAAGLASEVLQLLRLLQRDHWDAAVERLSSPVSSPYTLSFQTLPEHWRLISAFGTSRERGARNLLLSGEFEDLDTMIAEDWGNVHRAPEGLHTSAALFPTGRKKGYALRLECQPSPGAATPTVLDEPAVTITTPNIPVRAGQILHISGWVKVTQPLSASSDGLMIYDSLLGRAGSLRIHGGDQWTRFDLLRVVPETRGMTLSLSLTGLGQVLIDDLQVIPHDPRPETAAPPTSGEIQQTSGSSLLDRLPKLPRFTK